MIVLALALGCGDGGLLAREEPPVSVRTWLPSDPGAGGGTLMLQVVHDASLEIEVSLPATPTLTLSPGDTARTERIGDRIVETREWRYSGESGHHEIPPFEATWTGPSGSGEAASSILFVDIGVESPDVGELADISEPPEKWQIPWGTAVGMVAVGGLVGAGLWFAFARGQRDLPPAPPESPDVLAIRAWEAVRRDPALTDHAKALALSRIFREYAEAVLHFPATAWTTTETLERLRDLPHLTEGNVPRAKRLLRATDRVKYADAIPGADLFEELDADLRAFVGTTRPHAWQEPR